MSLERCSDGIDNDQNGYADCGDYSCSQSDDPAVKAHCDLILEATPDKCSDRIDNDGNGFVDCADYSCKKSKDPAVQAVCQESLGLTAAEVDANCSDGKDNDGDGFIDCKDWDCSWNPLGTVCKQEKRVCE